MLANSSLNFLARLMLIGIDFCMIIFFILINQVNKYIRLILNKTLQFKCQLKFYLTTSKIDKLKNTTVDIMIST